MEPLTDISVGVILIYTDSEGVRWVALVRHAARHWAFPKGHIDPGEGKEGAARRELYEETGVASCKLLANKSFTDRYVFERDGVQYAKEVTYFIGIAEKKDAIAPLKRFEPEIVEARWVSLSEARELISYPETAKIVEDVAAYLDTTKH